MRLPYPHAALDLWSHI